MGVWPCQCGLSHIAVAGMSAGRCSNLKDVEKLEIRTWVNNTRHPSLRVNIPVKTPTPIARRAGTKLRLILECWRLIARSNCGVGEKSGDDAGDRLSVG